MPLGRSTRAEQDLRAAYASVAFGGETSRRSRMPLLTPALQVLPRKVSLLSSTKHMVSVIFREIHPM